MRIDWMGILTIFIAIVAAEVFMRSAFGGGSIGGKKGSVGEVADNPVPVIYASPVDQYLHEHYPNAYR